MPPTVNGNGNGTLTRLLLGAATVLVTIVLGLSTWALANVDSLGDRVRANEVCMEMMREQLADMQHDIKTLLQRTPPRR